VTSLPGPVELDVFVPGSPAAQGSKAYKGHRVSGKTGKLAPVLAEQSRAVGPWRETVATFARQARGPAPLLDCALVLRLEFILPRPVGTPRRSTPPAVRRPDLDKMQRAVFDALSGVIFRDDSLVVDVHAVKRIAEIGEEPGCRIVLRRLVVGIKAS
jgi:crossover junction endodeoxyribonuclease RusA